MTINLSTMTRTALFSLLLIQNTFSGNSTQKNEIPQNRLGLAAGAPYVIGLTYERIINPEFSVQGQAGYLVIFRSLGVKLNWMPWSTTVALYFFLGDALIDSYAEDAGDPEGTANYIWFGSGVKYKIQGVKFFLEICALVGGDPDKGIGDDWIFPNNPAIGGGIAFSF